MPSRQSHITATLRNRLVVLAAVLMCVACLLWITHALHGQRFKSHVATFENENFPRYEAAYRLEDWSYSILSGVNTFGQARDMSQLRESYNLILLDIVGLEAAAADHFSRSSMVSNVEVNRLIEGLKHSLNTTLALKTVALQSKASERGGELSEQIASSEDILLQDLESLRALAVENRLAAIEAGKTDLADLQRHSEQDSQWVFVTLIVSFLVSGFFGWCAIVRTRTGLSEVARVLRREQADFSPGFFAVRDEFSEIAKNVQHFRAQEQKLIAARKAASESETRIEAFESAIANLTHDLKTPTSQITGLLGLIEEKDTAEETAGREIAMAKAATRRLSLIIHNVLDLTRSEMDRAEPISNGFDIKRTMDDLVASFRFNANERGLELRYTNDLSVKTVLQDEHRLTRIVSNLIDNAIKYTNVGHVEVTLSNTAPVDDSCSIQIDIKDTGIGIPEDQQADIFSKFGRAENHYAIDGLGLGLALVARFTKLLGGTVQIESKINKGTHFRVELPCHVLNAPTQIKIEHAKRATRQATPHVLIVDDDTFNLALGKAILAPYAHVTEAKNGLEAVELTKDRAFDLVIMDWRMPVMDGLTATREIRKREQEAQEDPVTIWGLTANATSEERAKAQNAGMEGLLAKPLSRENVQMLLPGLDVAPLETEARSQLKAKVG